MKKKLKILIATPCYNGMTHGAYTMSLAKTYEYFADKKNIELDFRLITSEALLPRARNAFASALLSDESFTHLLFIDSDMSFSPKDIMTLLSHDLPLVSASYPKKSLNWHRLDKSFLQTVMQEEDEALMRKMIQTYLMSYTFVPLEDNPHIKSNKLMEVKYAPTGFMLIQRQVFEALAAKYQDRKIHFPEPGYQDYNDHAYSFFDLDFGPNHYLSDDFSFCKRYREIGGKVFVDLSLKLGHHGQYDFFGNPLDMASFHAKQAAK